MGLAPPTLIFTPDVYNMANEPTMVLVLHPFKVVVNLGFDLLAVARENLEACVIGGPSLREVNLEVRS